MQIIDFIEDQNVHIQIWNPGIRPGFGDRRRERPLRSRPEKILEF